MMEKAMNIEIPVFKAGDRSLTEMQVSEYVCTVEGCGAHWQVGWTRCYLEHQHSVCVHCPNCKKVYRCQPSLIAEAKRV